MRVSVIFITMTVTQAYGRNVKNAGIWLGTIILRLIFMIPTMYQDINRFFRDGFKNCAKKIALKPRFWTPQLKS
jgi:hypothetical protein